MIHQGIQKDNITVIIDNDKTDPADEFAFEVSSGTFAPLAENGLGLTLSSPEGDVTLDPDVVAQASESGMALYFRIVSAEDETGEAQEAFLSDGIIVSLADANTMEVFGTPRIIETNMEGYIATIVLPFEGLDESKLNDPDFLDTLYVYVEHDDGTTELISGKVVNRDGAPYGMQFKISNYSRFQIVSIAAASNSGLLIGICIGAAVLLILLIVLLVLVQRNRKREKLKETV